MAEITEKDLVTARDVGRALAQERMQSVADGAPLVPRWRIAEFHERFPPELMNHEELRELTQLAVASAKSRWGELVSQRIADQNAPVLVAELRRTHRITGGIEETAIVTRAIEHFPDWSSLGARARAEARAKLEQLHALACYMATTDDRMLRTVALERGSDVDATLSLRGALVEDHRLKLREAELAAAEAEIPFGAEEAAP